MSQVSTHTAQTANPLSLFTLPAPTEIVLQGIIIERGRLFVFLACGRHNYTFEPRARVLLSFERFRDFVIDQEGILIGHESQRALSSRRRKRDWQAVLQIAFDRGCGR